MKQPIALDPGTLFVFGNALKTGSCSGQRMWGTEWSVLPQFLSENDVNKAVRYNASYVHIGGGRIYMCGGTASKQLKKVRFYALQILFA